MKRRTFIETVGLGLVTGPVFAQPTGRVHRIGFLSPVASQPAPLPPVEALREGLRAEGFVEGRNLAVEWRFAEWKLERLPGLAAELVHLKVEVIVAALEPAIIAARGATTSIPIVMATSADAVADGLVASLSKPGGNVTGMTAMSSVLSAKRLELLRDMAPSLARVAVLWNSANAAKDRDWQDTQKAATALRLAVHPAEARPGAELEAAFGAIRGARADGLVVLHDALTWSHRDRIVDFAARERLPAVYEATEWAGAGGLLAYGVTHADLFRGSASYVAKILRGARPAELPVQQPARIPLVVNVRTARALSLKVPPSLLARAELVGE